MTIDRVVMVDCPHCARPLMYMTEYNDVVYKSQIRQLNVIHVTKWQCTFCPVTVEVTYKMPPEYYPIGTGDSSSEDEWGP